MAAFVGQNRFKKLHDDLFVKSPFLVTSWTCDLKILTGKKTPSIKTPALTKSKNTSIWVVGTSEVFKLKETFQKNKVVTGKVPLFGIGPFYTYQSTCLNIGIWYGSFHGNNVFPISVVWTEKQYSIFLKKLFVFQKTGFKVKVLQTFKIFTYCHIKICRSLKPSASLKIPSTVFQNNLCSFCWL